VVVVVRPSPVCTCQHELTVTAIRTNLAVNDGHVLLVRLQPRVDGVANGEHLVQRRRRVARKPEVNHLEAM
jgi:hypothetical protein